MLRYDPPVALQEEGVAKRLAHAQVLCSFRELLLFVQLSSAFFAASEFAGSHVGRRPSLWTFLARALLSAQRNTHDTLVVKLVFLSDVDYLDLEGALRKHSTQRRDFS